MPVVKAPIPRLAMRGSFQQFFQMVRALSAAAAPG
jgi:hypothetical protein